jgi:hypothetical protein
MKILMNEFLKDDSGQDLIEYTLLMAFVALASERCSLAPVAASRGSGLLSIPNWRRPIPRHRSPGPGRQGGEFKLCGVC